jgi:hypothetical protein
MWKIRLFVTFIPHIAVQQIITVVCGLNLQHVAYMTKETWTCWGLRSRYALWRKHFVRWFYSHSHKNVVSRVTEIKEKIIYFLFHETFFTFFLQRLFQLFKQNNVFITSRPIVIVHSSIITKQQTPEERYPGLARKYYVNPAIWRDYFRITAWKVPQFSAAFVITLHTLLEL